MSKLVWLIGIASIAVARIVAAQTVADPVGALVRAGGVNKDDAVLVGSFDWNGDGKDDLLITTDADLSMGGRMGPDWSVWLSNSSGSYDFAGTVQDPTAETMAVARLSEIGGAKAILAYEPCGAGCAGITAYYLSSGGKVESMHVGMYETNDPARIDASEALQKRTFGSAVNVAVRRIPATEFWPKEGPSAGQR